LLYGLFYRTISHMKTTIDIDDHKVKRVMKLTGLKTRKATIDYALCQAEKAARVDRLVREALPGDAFTDAVDHTYDVLAIRNREQETPQ
jgi:Arc/MetJ family transcription regulator